MTTRTSNIKASYLVNSKQDFKGSNTFAETKNNKYVVYSYGYHFPMYAFINGQWYGNSNKYSSSTSKHQSQTRPSGTITYKTTNELNNLLDSYDLNTNYIS
jgi:hypothetical protein